MNTGRLKKYRHGLASRIDRTSGIGREGSSRLHLCIWCERSSLHDAYVEDSSVSRLVLNGVQNEHTVKCYLGLQVAYRHLMRSDMNGRIKFDQRILARMHRKAELGTEGLL
jgi:hypothetical protein